MDAFNYLRGRHSLKVGLTCADACMDSSRRKMLAAIGLFISPQMSGIRASGNVKTDYFAPRIGFAWTPWNIFEWL